MSSRPLFPPHLVVTNGDMSGSFTSEVTIIQKLSMISYHYQWVGTSPVGDVVVEVSNNYAQDASGVVKNAGTWDELPLSDATSVSGNSDSGGVDIDANAFYAIRTRYIRTSGTGTMNITVAGKVA